MIKYTDTMLKYLKEHSKVYSRKELTWRFNFIFHKHQTVNAIKKICAFYGFKAATDGKFVDGHDAWNKDMDVEEYKTHFTEESYLSSTQDTLPHDYKYKVGDRCYQSVNGKKVPYIVVSTEPGVELKHRCKPETLYVWEKIHGPVPDGYSIMHLDGDNMNNDISNLIMVSDYERLIINSYGWQCHPEIMKTGLMIAKLNKALKTT